MEEIGVDSLYRFAENPFRQRRAAAAGIVRDHQREPLILGPGPKSGFAQPGVSDHGDLAAVDRRILGQIVHGP